MKTILDIAFGLDKDSHDLFEGAKKKVNTPEGQRMFEQLSRFEEGHMRIIDDMRRQYA